MRLLQSKIQNGMRLELIWKILKPQSPMYIKVIHIVNSEGNILNQSDYPHDVFKRVVNKNKHWHEVVQILSKKLTGAKGIGLRIHVPSRTLLNVAHGSIDLGRQVSVSLHKRYWSARTW